MGADHPPAPPAGRRLTIALAAVLGPLFALTVVATVLLWPDPLDRSGDAEPVPRQHATVTKVVTEACPPTPEPGGPTECGTVTVRLAGGETVDTELPGGPGAPRVEVGDEVIVVMLSDPESPEVSTYQIADHQRGQPLIWLVALFAAAIIAFGRLRGLASLAGLAASFAILLLFVLPAILGGKPPLLVAVVGSALIMFVVLYLTHGVTARTSVAVLGTLASLVLTGVVGTLAIDGAHLTGYGSDDAVTLSLVNGAVDLHGLLLAGIIIGSLGVLDDVTVTQAATVAEVARANPRLSRLQLYRAGIRVGRAHIASTVNTIILAYAGASLPVLLLVIAGGRGVTEVLTTEFMAQEIVRGVVGTLGLIAAVPITTALAALATRAARPTARPAAPPRQRPATDPDDVLAALAEKPRLDPGSAP